MFLFCAISDEAEDGDETFDLYDAKAAMSSKSPATEVNVTPLPKAPLPGSSPVATFSKTSDTRGM